jgi:hypothetical protein
MKAFLFSVLLLPGGADDALATTTAGIEHGAAVGNNEDLPQKRWAQTGRLQASITPFLNAPSPLRRLLRFMPGPLRKLLADRPLPAAAGGGEPASGARPRPPLRLHVHPPVRAVAPAAGLAPLGPVRRAQTAATVLV